MSSESSKLDSIEILKVWHKVQGHENLIRMLNGELTVHAYLRQVIESATRQISEDEKKLAKEKSEYETEKKEAEEKHSNPPFRYFLNYLEHDLETKRKQRRLALECLSSLRKEA